MDPHRTTNRPLADARTPREYLERLEARTLRRIAGGLVAVDRRGSTAFGLAWRPLTVATGALGAVLGWRSLRSLGGALGPLLAGLQGRGLR